MSDMFYGDIRVFWYISMAFFIMYIIPAITLLLIFKFKIDKTFLLNIIAYVICLSIKAILWTVLVCLRNNE